MKAKGLGGIVTFKVDEELASAMRAIPNRSEFIRKALKAALEDVCPLCSGSGVLDGQQRKHWQHFLEDHAVERCEECRAQHLVCLHSEHPSEMGGGHR